MKIYTNEYTQKVFDILEPLAGKSMAQAILKVQCAAIGCNEETLQLKDMPELAEALKKVWSFFWVRKKRRPLP